jgi:hypothetical protein
MWSKQFSKKYNNVSAKQVWDVWTDINQWQTWQDDIDFAKLDLPFTEGSTFAFRPKGGPDLKLELTEVTPLKSFTDLTQFPSAKMYDQHEIIIHNDGIELKMTLTIKGPLAFLWKKIVAENVANGFEKQSDKLVERVLKINE